MKQFEGYKKKALTADDILLANGGNKDLGDFVGSLYWNSETKTIQIRSAKINTYSNFLTFGDRAFDSTSYLPLTGGTLSGTGRLIINGAGNTSSTDKWLFKIIQGGDIGSGLYDTMVISANDVCSLRIGETDGTEIGLCGGDQHGTLTSTHDFRFYTGVAAGATIYSGGGGTLGLTITGSQALSPSFKSTVATGTLPYQCTSTTLNTNLNADMVDGYHANNLAKSTSSETTMQLIAKNQNSTLGMIYGNDNPEGTKNWWHLFLANYNNNSESSGSDGNFWSCQIINRAGTTNPYIRSRAGGNDINSGWTGWSRMLTDSNWTSVITLSSLGAAPSHDHPYVRTYLGVDVNPSTTYGYWHAMTTLSGISSSWWHIIHMDWSGAANWRSELALPTLHRTGVYYRSDNWEWSSWIMLLDTSSTAQTKSGNLTCANFYTTSDHSKKQNISSFSEHIRKFQLKDTEKWHYGVIAQEVPEMFRDGEEGNMTVNYNSVLSYYIGLLENKVKELEEKLNKIWEKYSI